MESLGLDYMVVFPTGMLSLGMHPQLHMEVLLGSRLQPVDGGNHAESG